MSSKKNGTPQIVINPNLIVYEWPGKRPVGWRDFLFAYKKIQDNKPDIVITNFAANNIMLLISWLFKVKIRICYYHTMVQQYLQDHHSIDLKQRFNISRKRFVLKIATHILPATNAAKEDLIQFYNVNEHKVFIFPNALPDTVLRNLNNNATIGFLGRLDRSKGVDVLINAFKIVADKVTDAQLLIAGKGVKEEELKTLSQKLSIQDRVIFKGPISYTDVLKFLTEINFLVVPSRMDNLPTVALEALSVSTPVIASNTGGIPDIIIDNYNGLLFQNEDAEDLAKKMIWLLQNKEAREKMCINARKVFEEKYCIDNLLTRFEALMLATT